MSDFYKKFYSAGYLGLAELNEAVVWGLLTEAEYQEITGEVYGEGEEV